MRGDQREERYLERTFEEEYLGYRRRVRRWVKQAQLLRIPLLGRCVNRGQERFSLSCCDYETHLVSVKALGPWGILYVLIGSLHPPNDPLFGDSPVDFRELREAEVQLPRTIPLQQEIG